MKRAGMRGVTLMELMVVIALSVILMGMAGFTAHGLYDRYDAERQVRQMHSDVVNARVRAFQLERRHFVIVTTNGYQLAEDTNESGGTMPDPGDRVLWSMPKTFKFGSHWSGTLIMDAKGIMAKSTGPLEDKASLEIRFDTVDVKPECDCLSIGPTRIKEGKWNGVKCAAR